jgi:transcriptional regulator NrdR family protein
MKLNDSQKKKIADRALGESITGVMNIHDQIAAIRKQAVANAKAAKADLVQEMQTLEQVVEDQKSNGKKT